MADPSPLSISASHSQPRPLKKKKKKTADVMFSFVLLILSSPRIPFIPLPGLRKDSEREERGSWL